MGIPDLVEHSSEMRCPKGRPEGVDGAAGFAIHLLRGVPGLPRAEGDLAVSVAACKRKMRGKGGGEGWVRGKFAFVIILSY